ncbi:hypothetical protein ANN_14258 [Periplaneta americana]|uniref:PiggyBac transposable element-derived protein domain-containing protein n=1 Tax=Periplaneta americana TaxID=6978 RepID=A0ABQ8SX58_PERAM|nr:hypothetical protein ANN_14258 [Periplaneta americana]
MPSYRMYWADATRFSPIADVMVRNRFDKLRTYFHVNDNSNMKARDDPNYDKLFKVRPFIDRTRTSFLETEPEGYNSVDELIIPFKGRSSLKQYVKNKPHKWGIKVFARAGTSGIVNCKDCTLKTDNELKKLGRGSFDFRSEAEKNAIALKWYDNKAVHLVSSYKERNPVENVKQWSVAEGKHIDIPKPKIVKKYNCFIGGVDLHDILVVLYRSNIGVKQFYLRIIFHLLDMCVVNG